MYLTRLLHFIKKFAQNRREMKLQPTFTPGWEAHPGVKLGYSFVARQKKPLLPVRVTNREERYTFTPGW